jgi:hypothetical protein
MLTTPHDLLLGHFTGGCEPRALLAGVTFLDVSASRSFGLRGLGLWFEEHVVATGCMAACPAVVFESPVGSVDLYPWKGASMTVNAEASRIIAAARARVVAALRGIIATPSEDRFLRGAIFLGSTRRQGSRWVARPAANALLSDVVLSLFAAAILSDRSAYERELCVCSACGRVSFDARPQMRTGCARHPAWISDFRPVVTVQDLAPRAEERYRHSVA